MADDGAMWLPQRTILDNSTALYSVAETLRHLFALRPERIDIATAYWDLKAITLLADELRNFLSAPGHRLRLLVERDLTVTNPHNHGSTDTPLTLIHKRIEELPIDGPNQAAVRLLLDCLQHGNDSDTPPRLCVRLYNGTLEDAAQFLHAKCYIFYYNSQSTYGTGAVSIVGSSNFTSRGLQGNLELNSLEPDSQVVTAKPTQYNPTKGVAQWYEEHWHLGSPLNEFVEQSVRSSGIGRSLMSFHYTFGSDGKVLTASETIVEREARYTELSAAAAEARHEMPAPLQLHFLRLQEFWRNEPARYNALAKCSLPLIAPAGEDAKEQTSMLTVREGGRLHFLAADSSGQYESLPLVTFLDRLYALGQVRGPAPDSASAACQGALTWLRRTQAKVQLNIDHYERASKKTHPGTGLARQSPQQPRRHDRHRQSPRRNTCLAP